MNVKVKPLIDVLLLQFRDALVQRDTDHWSVNLSVIDELFPTRWPYHRRWIWSSRARCSDGSPNLLLLPCVETKRARTWLLRWWRVSRRSSKRVTSRSRPTSCVPSLGCIGEIIIKVAISAIATG